MTTAPQIDARALAALRKRTFTGARKALQALDEVVTSHRGEFEAGYVPPAAGLRKTFEKYAQLLATLDIADSLLSPEALEAMNEEDAPEPGTAVVNREDLALLTRTVRALVPDVPAGDGTPLGRLTRAAYPVPPATAPDGEHDPGCPPMSADEM